MKNPAHKNTGITGVILAGGQSSRMGSNKALLPYRGGRFIEAIYRQFSLLFDDVLLVTNTPEQYQFLECRKVPDLFPGMGALAGLHSGLYHSMTPHCFAAACDMPYLSEKLIRYLAARRHAADVVIPEGEQGLEPLHTIYSHVCLSPMEAALRSGRRRIISFFPDVSVTTVDRTAIAALDPGFASFRNINTPADYYGLRDDERHPGAAEYSPPAAVTTRQHVARRQHATCSVSGAGA